jgi:hypothetical protein
VPLFSSRPRPPESYYRRRRDDFAAGVTIGAAIFAGLMEGAYHWLLIVRGVRRLDPAHGLWAFISVVIKGALVGAVIGYGSGWAIGFLWERWHRRRRARRGVA